MGRTGSAQLAGRYLFWRPEPKWEFNTKTGSRIRCGKSAN